MYKHLMTATALLGLSLVGPAVRADSRDQQRAQQHMQSYLGVRADTAARQEEPEGGVAIQTIQPNGPAARAGLRRGDNITRVGRRVVEDFDDLCNAITRHQPGDRVTIHARRDGQERTFHVNLSERAAYWMPQADEEREGQGRFGRQQQQDRYGRWQDEISAPERDLDRLARGLERLEERLREQADFSRDRLGSHGSSRSAAVLGVGTRAWMPSTNRRGGGMAREGVVVTDVDPDSPAAEYGLRHGDVITAINGRDIATPQELRQAMQRAGTNREITLEVLRGDRQREVRVPLEARSASAEDIQLLQQLVRRIEQLEDRMQDQGDFSHSRQDRYGRRQGTDADPYRDHEELQRHLQQLENRLRDIEQNQQSRRPQDR